MTKNQISDFPTIPSTTPELINNSGFLTAIPMASDTDLGGVIIDGGNLNITATGKLEATIVKNNLHCMLVFLVYKLLII